MGEADACEGSEEHQLRLVRALHAVLEDQRHHVPDVGRAKGRCLICAVRVWRAKETRDTRRIDWERDPQVRM